MNTKTFLSLAVAAILPFSAMAANISGNMYTAPLSADANHPAPITGAGAPYGRIDIDAADQEHIATTAYVKGAYNSAIAAVNKVNDEKQGKLLNSDDIPILPDVLSGGGGVDIQERILGVMAGTAHYFDDDWTETLLAADEIAGGIARAVQSQRVKIYTTWDDDSDNATTQVSLLTAQQ